MKISVLVFNMRAGETTARWLAELCDCLASTGQSFEVLAITPLSHLRSLPSTATNRVRIVPVDSSDDLGLHWSVGIAAATGEEVVAIDSQQYPPQQVLRLAGRLTRVDLVHGRRRRPWPVRALVWSLNLPRWLMVGREVRDPGSQFWAARREAVAGLHLAGRMHSFLPELASARGYRVGEVYVDESRLRTHALRRAFWLQPRDLWRGWRRIRAARRAAVALPTEIMGDHVRIDPAQALPGSPAAAGRAGNRTSALHREPRNEQS